MNKEPHILIAEDDADDRLMIMEVLDESPETIRYTFASDGEALLDLLKPGPLPSLILLDLNMPKIDGRQALRIIRSEPGLQAVPVVVFTTSVNSDDRERCMVLGANDYIAKPSSYPEMRLIVRNLYHNWLNPAL